MGKRVTAIVVVARLEGGGVRWLTQGEPLPDDITEESEALLDELGYTADDGEKPAKKPAKKAAAKAAASDDE